MYLIYYKGLAHVAAEAKSRGLQSASWRPRRAHVWFQAKLKSEGRRSPVSQLEETAVPAGGARCPSWRRPVSQLEDGQADRVSPPLLSLWSYSGQNWVEDPVLLSLPIQMLTSSRNSLHNV